MMEKVYCLENNQFLSRNQTEIIRVFLAYRELLEVHPSYVMYMDKTSWELFDPDFGVTIFRHEFKHLKSMLEELRQLRYDIIAVGCIKYREYTDRPAKRTQTCALKRLLNYYTDEQLNYFKYGTLKKTEISADNH